MRGSDVRFWVALALVAVVPLLAGCSSVEGLDDLLFATPETEGLPGSLSIPPLFEMEWKDSVVQWGVRPLFSVRQYFDIPLDARAQYKVPYFGPLAVMKPGERRTPPRARPGEPSQTALQVLALYPLYRHESCGEQSRTYFYPFYYDVRDTGPDGEHWHHWAFFPLYFGGHTDSDGSYDAVFPFGGVLKNWLGRDRIEFIMFPLYAHVTTDERESYNILWPIFNYAHGGGRERWYLWPLVGWSKRHDDPARWYFLWPLFWYTEEPEEGETDTGGYGVWPLYTRLHHGDVDILNIVWPFYSYAKNQKTGRTDRVIVWPVGRFGDGPDYYRREVWPFYGYLEDDNVTRSYVMWPLYRRERHDTDRLHMSGWSVMMLYRSIYNEWIDDGGVIRNDYESVLWPFYYYKRDGLGNSFFCATSLGTPDPQGWDRFYSSLLRLVQTETRTDFPGPPDNVWHSTQVLWGLFKYQHDDLSSHLRVFPFFSTAHETGERSSLEVLLGLFGYADEPGQRTYKLFFIPWTVSREE